MHITALTMSLHPTPTGNGTDVHSGQIPYILFCNPSDLVVKGADEDAPDAVTTSDVLTERFVIDGSAESIARLADGVRWAWRMLNERPAKQARYGGAWACARVGVLCLRLLKRTISSLFKKDFMGGILSQPKSASGLLSDVQVESVLALREFVRATLETRNVPNSGVIAYVVSSVQAFFEDCFDVFYPHPVQQVGLLQTLLHHVDPDAAQVDLAPETRMNLSSALAALAKPNRSFTSLFQVGVCG